MIHQIFRSFKIIALGVVITATSFIAWKHQGFQGSQKIAAVHQDVPKNSSVQPQQVAPTTALASVHLPAPMTQPSEEELREFPGATVVEASETEGPEPGQEIHLRLLKTHFKYPLIRMKEIVDVDRNSVVAREEMVATHFLVTLPQGENPNVFLKKMGSLVTSMVRVTQDAPLYRANLTASSLGALPQALQQAATVTKGVGEPDFIGHPCDVPNDIYFQNQWNLLKPSSSQDGVNGVSLNKGGIDAEAAWDLRTDASSIVVAVVDTGIRYTHEDLAANMWHNPAPSDAGDIYGWNAYGNNGDPMDSCAGDYYSGHGTHCAGIIGAVGNNDVGITGVAWNVQLMACKYFGGSGGTYSDAIVCVDYAIDHGAKIISCSFIGPSVSAVYDVFNRARSARIIVVAAAGNYSSNNDISPQYPANYQLDNIVSVAATDETDQLASFSNYGATTVHLAAPGNSIYSTYNSSDSSYVYMSGTSMAAPHVAGALALMMAQSPRLSYQELIGVLLDSTDKLPALEGKTISGGRLNVGNALMFLCSNSVKDIKEYFVKKRFIIAQSSSIITQDEAKRGGGAPVDLTVVPPRKIPLVPVPLNQLSDEEKKFFGYGGSVIQACEIEGPRPGQKIRIRILDTFYLQEPYLRIEELIDTASNLVITRKEMAADHFLVTLPEGEDPDLFLKKFGTTATSIKQVTQAAPLYQVQLSNPQAIETLPKVLKQAAGFTTGVSEPDFIIHTLMIPNDPFFKNQWGLSTTMDFLDPSDNVIKTCHGAHVDEAWNIRTEAPSVMVALIDSGITGVHDIENNLWKNPSYHPSKPGWGNATGIDLYPRDDGNGGGAAYNHASHSAEIIGATGNDGVGIAGIAWKVQLLNCKVCSYAGQGLVSDEIRGVDFALNHGAKILNCAFGSNNYSYCEHQALERSRAAGAIVVAAAGNEGLNNDQFPTYPASYRLDNIVSVAANTGTQELADFSNYGASTVHLTAPGVHIYSASDYWGYDYFDGTSAATAFVSGALALMREEFPLASAQELIARLLAAVDKVPSSQGKTVSGGALNVAKALKSR